MRTTGPENENGICRGAAPQTRGEPGPRPECGRQVTVVEKAGSQRSSRVAQFDRADQRPYAILVDCLIARNTRLMERVGKQLSKSRSHCVSTGKASRRFFRYRTGGRGAVRGVWCGFRVFAASTLVRRDLPEPQAGGGRRSSTRISIARAAKWRTESRSNSLFADRASTATLRANAPLLCDFRQRCPGTTGLRQDDKVPQSRRPHLRAQGSAPVFLAWKEPFARVLANLRAPTQRRPRAPPKAGATFALADAGGIEAVRESSSFIQGKTPDSPAGPRAADRSKNRAGNLDAS